MKNENTNELTLEVGKNYNRLNENVNTESEVVWSSDNEDVVSVNPLTGYVFANGAGSATVYATAVDDGSIQASYTFHVTEPVYVEKVTIQETVSVLHRGDVLDLTAIVEPTDASNPTVRWYSNRPRVAHVNAITGKVTARTAGIAVICAVAVDRGAVCDAYTIRVRQTAKQPTEEVPQNKGPGSIVADPIDACSGAHIINNTVMSLYGGQGLKLTVHYNSTNMASGELGIGWYHNYDKRVVKNENENCWYVYQGSSVYAKYLALNGSGTTYRCSSAHKSNYVLTDNVAGEYRCVINCNSERTEYYNADGRLAKIVDHQGFETTIQYTDTMTTITDCVSGKKIYLEKNAEGKLVYVYDDDNDDAARVATFCYSNNSDNSDKVLTMICDVNGHALTYTYDEENRIKKGTDSENICYFENTYDDNGRIVSQKDAIPGSMETTIIYDDEANKRIVKDRNGHVSTRQFNDDGLLIRNTDENGSTRCFVYDEHYNLVCETDANGNSIYKCYNAFNKPVEITDQNGNITRMEYDSAGNVIKIYYPEVNHEIPEESFVYNSRNQLVQHTDCRGTVTVYTYDTNGIPASKKVGNRNTISYHYENGLLKSVTDARGYVTRYRHNAIGQVISMIDANNQETKYTYDACGNLLSTTDANGKTIVTTYDGNYQKTSVTDANGNRTQYSYNGNMKNDSVTLPDGNTIRYEFDGEDRVIRITDQCNNVTQMTYDAGGRLVRRVLADGATVKYTYDAVGNVIEETNPNNAIVTKTYDHMGNVLTVTDHEGNTTWYEYNAMNKVVRVTNAVAGTTLYEYSKAGDLLCEIDALGNKKTYTYDAFGNRLTATDAKNNVTTYTYDQNNNLLTVKDALNHTTTYTYNALNQCVSVQDAQHNIIRYAYDALGRRTTITDACGNMFITTYDGNGNVIKTNDAKGNTISETTYNSLNLPAAVTDAMGKTTTYTYNALGKVEIVTDPLNHRTEYTYNSRGQNTEVLDAASNVSTATYDQLGNVTRLAGPLGGATNYTYDDMGRLVTESTVSGGTKKYEYNELNIRKKITNARGQIRQLFYDAMGRITGYTAPEGAVSYTYDANGNVLTVTDRHGTIARTYDALNRVTSYTDTYGKVICYEYDAVGNLSKLIYPDNTAVTYAYDENRNLVRVTDWANRVTAYTYDENNRVVGVTKPDGSVTTTTYDHMQRVTSTMEKLPSGAIITGFEYTYDNLSRIIEEKVLANSTKMCYTYDDLNRVTNRTIKNMSNVVLSEETFTYDAAGNVTSAPDSSFRYDINNRLISYNGSTLSYDADGNMLWGNRMGYQYDSANRLISAGGHAYTYNAEDVRIRNLCEDEDEDTIYTYNTNAKLSQLLMKTTNGAVTKYVYGRGLIGEETNNSFKTYHFDCRGSTIAITDASGNITDTFAYDTYGKLICRTGVSEVIFCYNGRDGVVTDENGLVYMRARYYSPDMRRFINADIVAGAISNAVTLNRFAFANGNPVSFVDPFGLRAMRRVDTGSNMNQGDCNTPNGFTSQWELMGRNVSNFLSDARIAVKDWWNKDVVEPVKDRWNKDVVEPVKDWWDKDVVEPVKDWLSEEIVKPVTDAAEEVQKQVVLNLFVVTVKTIIDIVNYDEKNTDVQKVYDSHYFSSYNGATVIRFSSDFICSFGIDNIIFLNHSDDPPVDRAVGSDEISLLNHEHGHTQQCEELGLEKYLLFVAAPSIVFNLLSRDNEWLRNNYYSMPWEYDANVRGEVTGIDTAFWAPVVHDIYFNLIG